MNYLDEIKKIDCYLDNNKISEDIFKILNNNRQLEDYFFKKVKSPEWFYPIKNHGYFAPQNNPKPYQDPDNPDSTIIPYWSALNYLEIVSESLKEDDENLSNELLTIIREVTNFIDEKEEHIDNYSTWNSFIKILSNIPNKYIKEEDINLLNLWLKTKFHNSILSAEIANNLFPKFIKSKEWIKAEILFNIITNTKKENKYDHKTLIDDYWLKELLEKYGKEFGTNCSDKIIYTISDKLIEIIKDKNKDDYFDFDFNDLKYRLTVTHIKDNVLSIKLDKFPKRELTEQDEIDDLTGSLAFESIFKERKIESTDEKSFLKNIKDELIKIPELKDLKYEFHDIFISLYERIFDDYSYHWYKNMFSDPDIIERDADSLLTHILRVILLNKSKSEKEENQKSIKKVFNEFSFSNTKYPYTVFKRLLLYLIGINWKKYNDKFWKLLDENHKELFNDINYKNELFDILKKEIKTFTPKQKNAIKNYVENGPYVDYKIDDETKVRWRQERYDALKSDKFFAKLYDKCKEITKTDIKFIPIGLIETRWGPGPSPLSKDEMLILSNEELVKETEKPIKEHGWDAPTKEALALSFNIIAKENPDKFLNDYEPLLKLTSYYISEIFRGFRDAWNSKTALDWDKLFEFINSYIKQEQFRENTLITPDVRYKANSNQVVKDIASLIEAGTKDDNNAFDKKYNDTAKETIFELLKMTFLKSEKRERNVKNDSVSDAVHIAINSTYGELIEALIDLSLRIVRLKYGNMSDETHKWDKELKVKYTELLDKNINEAYTFLGYYNRQFSYLDNAWKKEQFEKIGFEHPCWLEFIEGFLYVSEFSNETYKLMKKHYEKAIGFNFNIKRTDESLINHITIGYLRGLEKLEEEDNLFIKLIEAKSFKPVPNIISFFSQQQGYILKNREDFFWIEASDRIIRFWEWIIKELDNNKIDETTKREILSDLILLTPYLENIDDRSFEWLKKSAPYVDVNYHIMDFIKILKRLIVSNSDNIEKIADIYIEILKGSHPHYDFLKTEDIKFIIESIYEAGYIDKGNEICNRYAEKGYYDFKDLYEKYNL